MARYLVVFQSHPEPPFDTTAVEVRGATSQLEAVRDAKQGKISHPWSFVFAIPWPRGCRNVNAAAKKIAKLRRAG